MSPRLLVMIPAFVFVLPACSPTRFVRTDASHIEARGGRPPAVFIGEGPDRPWRAVGRIEVTLTGKATTEEVMTMAVDAGQQAGCELLAQGIQPRHSNARRFSIQLAVLRNGHDHGDHAPPAPPARDAPEPRSSSSSGESSSSSSSGSSSGGAEAASSGGGEVGRTRRWKFECGVYVAPPTGVSPI